MNNQKQNHFRIIEKGIGFTVEISRPKWTLFGLNYKWEPFIEMSGLKGTAVYFETRLIAESNFVRYLKKGL